MVLEAIMICLDNSDWSRDGDFTPTRLDAQQETANLICGSKTQANPENAVGLLCMGGTRVTVSVAPTTDMGNFLQALHGIQSHGKIDLVRGIQTAQLALKHRLNRNQRQRIVVFVCSPVETTEKRLEQLGKTLKKNNVSIDIVSFGQVAENSRLLTKLFSAANSNNTSHLVEVPDTSMSLTRAVGQSAIIGGDGGGPVNELGVDPNLDPELYQALMLSLEEERARARREQAARVTQEPHAVTGGISPEDQAQLLNPDTTGPPAEGFQVRSPSVHRPPQSPDRPPTVEDIQSMNIDEDLRQALLLSLQEYNVAQQGERSQGVTTEAAPAAEAVAAPPTTQPKEKEPSPGPAPSGASPPAESEAPGGPEDVPRPRPSTHGSSSSLEYKTPASSEASLQDDGLMTARQEDETMTDKEQPRDAQGRQQSQDSQTQQQPQGSQTQAEPPSSEAASSGPSFNPALMQQFMRNLPGVNFHNPAVQNALRSIPTPQQRRPDERRQQPRGKQLDDKSGKEPSDQQGADKEGGSPRK